MTDLGREIADTRGVSTEATSKSERSSVLDAFRTLLAEGRSDAVVDLAAKLVARNSELEQRLAALMAGARKKNEGVSSEQLLLLLEGEDDRKQKKG